jgi:hypothetical protein
LYLTSATSTERLTVPATTVAETITIICDEEGTAFSSATNVTEVLGLVEFKGEKESVKDGVMECDFDAEAERVSVDEHVFECDRDHEAERAPVNEAERVSVDERVFECERDHDAERVPVNEPDIVRFSGFVSDRYADMESEDELVGGGAPAHDAVLSAVCDLDIVNAFVSDFGAVFVVDDERDFEVV